MTRKLIASLSSMALAGLLFCACGNNGSGSPLGGPYGGGAYRLGPTDGGYNNVDASYSPKRPGQGAGPYGDHGTWTYVYSAYLAQGTVGNCYPCHKEMSDPRKAYRYLDDAGYMGGKNPSLTAYGTSCLSWYGGNMPTGAPIKSDTITMEMDLWASQGGKNN